MEVVLYEFNSSYNVSLLIKNCAPHDLRMHEIIINSHNIPNDCLFDSKQLTFQIESDSAVDGTGGKNVRFPIKLEPLQKQAVHMKLSSKASTCLRERKHCEDGILADISVSYDCGGILYRRVVPVQVGDSYASIKAYSVENLTISPAD